MLLSPVCYENITKMSSKRHHALTWFNHNGSIEKLIAGRSMKKLTLNSDWISPSSLIYASLMMILLSLLVTFGIELLIKELMRLG